MLKQPYAFKYIVFSLGLSICLSLVNFNTSATIANNATPQKNRKNIPLNLAQNPADNSANDYEKIVTAVYLKQDGYTLFRQGEPEEALAKYQEALAIFRELDHKVGEGDILNYIGELQLAINNYDQALDSFQQALDIFKKLNQYPEFDRSYEGFTLQYLGETYAQKHDFRKAIHSYQQALEIFSALKDSGQGDVTALEKSIIYTLNPLSSIYFQQGDYHQSLTIYRQILALQPESSVDRVQTLNNLGVVYSNLNQYAQAFEYYQKALDLLSQFSDCDINSQGKVCYAGDEASIFNNLATLYFTIGQYEQAINFSQQATILYQRLKSADFYDLEPRDFQFLYDVIGTSSINALFTHQSLAIRPAVGDNYHSVESIVQQGEAVNYNNLGQIYNSQNQPDQALIFYQKALDIYQMLDNQKGLGITYNNMASVYLSLGQFDQALALNGKALNIYQEVADQAGIGITLSNLGQIYSEQGDLKQGTEELNQALVIHQGNNDRSSIALTLRNLGLIQLKEGNLAQAIDNLKQAIDIIESLRPGLSDASKVALFETQSLAYSWLQKALIEDRQFEEALLVAENSKARAFLELLTQRLNDSELVNFIRIEK